MSQDYGEVLDSRPTGLTVNQQRKLRSEMQPEGISDMFYKKGTPFGDQNIKERENRNRKTSYDAELQKLLSTNQGEENATNR